MYHSVTFGDKNSWDDWHLISKDRPYIAQPTPKTKYVELAGASGTIDLTEALTGLPTYNDRTGSLEFIIDYDYWANWNEAYDAIANYLNGYRYKMMLEDEPYTYYIGRFSVSSYAPGNSANSPWATITINYTLYPYKYKLEDVLVATLPKNADISVYPSAVESEVIVTENMLFDVAPTFYLYGIDGEFGLTIRDCESATQVDGKGILKIEDYYCVIDYQVRNNSAEASPHGDDTWNDYIPDDNEFVNRIPTQTYYGKCNLWYFARVTYDGGEVIYTPKVVLTTFGKSGLKNRVNLLDIYSYYAASEYTTGVTTDGGIPPKVLYNNNFSTVKTFVNDIGSQSQYEQWEAQYDMEAVVKNYQESSSNQSYSMGYRSNQTTINIGSTDYTSMNNIYYSLNSSGSILSIFDYVTDTSSNEECVKSLVEALNDTQKAMISTSGDGTGTGTKGPCRYTEVGTRIFSSSQDEDSVKSELIGLDSMAKVSSTITWLDGDLSDNIDGSVSSLISRTNKYLYALTYVIVNFIDYSSDQTEYNFFNVASVRKLGENAYGGIDEEAPTSDVVEWIYSSDNTVHNYYPDGSMFDLPELFDDRKVYTSSTMYGSYDRTDAGHDDNMWMFKTISTNEEEYISPETADDDPEYESEYKIVRSDPFILASYKPGSIEVTNPLSIDNFDTQTSRVVGGLHVSFASIDDYHGNTDISVAYLSTFRDYSVLKTSKTKYLKNFSASPVNSPVYEGDKSLYYKHIWNPEVGELAIRSITTFFKASSKDSGETAGDGTVNSNGVDPKGFTPSWSGEQWYAVDGSTPYLWVYERIEYENGAIMITDAHIAATVHAYNAIIDTDSSGNAVREGRAIQFVSLERAYTFTDNYILDPTSDSDMANLSDWQVRTEADYVTPPSGGAMAMFIRYKVHYKGYAPYLYVRFRVHYNANDDDDMETLYFKLPPGTFDKLRHYQIRSAKVYYLKTDKKSDVTRSTSGWKDYANHVAKDRPYLWSYQAITLSNGETFYTTPRIIVTIRDNTKLSDNASSAKNLIWYNSMNDVGLMQQDDNRKMTDPDWHGIDQWNKQFYIRYEIEYKKKVNEDVSSAVVKRQYTYIKIHSSDISKVGVQSVQHMFKKSAKSSGVKRGDSGWSNNWHNVEPDKMSPYLWTYQVLTLYGGQKIRTSPKVIGKFADLTERGENHFVNTTPGKLVSEGFTFDDDYSTGPIKIKGNRHIIVYGSRKNQSKPNRTGQLRMKYWKEVL